MKQIDPEKEIANIVSFITNAFQKAGFTRGVIGVSGGVDSAVSLALAIRALGAENVFPVLLPHGSLSTRSTLDAMELVGSLGIPRNNITRIDIEPAVREISKSDPGMDRLRRGNIMARVRMTCLFDQAKKRNALVVGTENKSEHMLGYFTRFGDEASDVEPCIHLYKTQIYNLARALKISETILKKTPSADLYFEQTDESELGFTYKDADEIMYLLYDEKKTEAEVVLRGFSDGVVKKVKLRTEQNAFKHNMPICYVPSLYEKIVG